MDDPDLDSGRLNVRNRAEKRAQFVVEPLADDERFTEFQTPCMIKPSGVRFNNQGDLEMLIVIPAKWANVLPVMKVAMRTPLLATFEPYRNPEL